MKTVIYQLFVRLFGNRNVNNKFYGSLYENGCGKFNDVSDTALAEIKRLGVTHIWFTGIIEHATMTDYSVFGISRDDPDVVKGKAGSPYAIKDYYDVDPDLAEAPDRRMKEFENLVERTHRAGLKVIIDFVPNHLARTYKSDSKPRSVRDFGEDDNTDVFFDKNNNFYYITGEKFVVPENYNPGGDSFFHPMKDGKFFEYPAKASGNDIFTAAPNIDDWFETIKLNYGIDFSTGSTHFDPIPDTWNKMLDILLFWAGKNIDGWRCDMCEMPPVEFWRHAIPKVKKCFPHLVFIGEAYSPSNYGELVSAGFDCLYDKSGLYDLLKAVATGNAGFDGIQRYLKSEIAGLEKYMLTFLENHDEQRFASEQFAGSPEKAIPFMTLAATIHSSPVMIYFGQEVGAKASGATGFSGDDGKTSIFDYTYIPEIQQWANGGKFDGSLLNKNQKALRNFYVRLLNLCNSESAIYEGKFGDLSEHNRNSRGFNFWLNYAFTRYSDDCRLIIFITADCQYNPDLYLRIPEKIFTDMKLHKDLEYRIKDILYSGIELSISGKSMIDDGIHVCTDKPATILKIDRLEP
ncbi:MAG: alpha-amylase family protein [Prevotellaceae bacterium]|jgi:glycosidase|nr:alpha-amylase family protein [Prevotellaceae bacterium]